MTVAIARSAAMLTMLSGCAYTRPPMTRPVPVMVTANAESTTEATPGSTVEPAGVDPVIQRAFAATDENTRAYDLHISFLANPALKGRLPGTPGSAIAKNYIEWNLRQIGLEPVFMGSDHSLSFRQPFNVGADTEIVSQRVELAFGDQRRVLTPGVDYNVLGNSASGSVSTPVTFAGFAVVDGPDGYNSFGVDNEDIDGRIALITRFEPMDEEGQSLWASSGWSPDAAIAPKFEEADARGASAIILVTPPHADDRRVGTLEDARSMRAGLRPATVPVIHMSPDTADAIFQAGDDTRPGIEFFTNRVSQAPSLIEIDGATLSIDVEVEKTERTAENVAGVLRGVGDLANEYIVVGGHHDHVGLGYFGVRSSAQRGQIHEGADDNASGTAGVILAAQLVADAYAAMPEDAPRRSVVFMTFDAEESGLNGAKHYVQNPPVPLTQHYAMLNMDMIGRIEDASVSLSGLGTAEELEDLLDPILEASPLKVSTPTSISGRSDHFPFYQAGVPAMFLTIADLHTDYHTPADELWKINRVGATRAAELTAEMTLALATNPGPLTSTVDGTVPEPSTPSMGSVKIRFGIAPGAYDDTANPGVLVGSVFDGTSAAEAGVQEGDRIVNWDGSDITDVADWMPHLAKHEPGDEIKITVKRGDELIVLDVVLQARGTGG